MFATYVVSVLMTGHAVASDVEKVVFVPVVVASVGGACRYWNTDVGLTSTQLADHLGNISDKTRQVELLLDEEPPEQCVADGVSAAYRAGFRRIAVRPKTARDLFSGPPR